VQQLVCIVKKRGGGDEFCNDVIMNLINFDNKTDEEDTIIIPEHSLSLSISDLMNMFSNAVDYSLFYLHFFFE
jgi:hypothetical protein